MPTLRHNICGAKSKEEAIERFWEALRTANGPRRQDPKDYAEVQQVRPKEGAWVVYYSVPSRMVRDIIRAVE